MTDTLENAVQGLQALGASVTDRDLVAMIARHVREEGEILASYQEFTHRAHSAAARYLVGMVLDDERRHHKLLTEMANAIAWQVPEQSPEPAVPALPLPGADGEDEDLKRETRRLLAAERADRAELRRLARALRPYRETTAWQLIVDVMRADTEKHIRILTFILDHAAG